MKKTKILLACFTALFIAYVSQSCEEPTITPPETPFVATSATFANYATWTLVASNSGPDPSLGAAHGGNDSTVTREIYYKDNQDPVDGEYPIGTVIVKRSYNPSGTVDERTAMVKRGNNFNVANNDWEWFKLDSVGAIAVDTAGVEQRGGASFMSGMCGGCHSNATTDYSFSK